MVETKGELVTDKMIGQFIDPEEFVMVQTMCMKLKANGSVDKTPRVYVQTTDYIYTFKSGKRSRFYHIKDVGAIILSSQKDTDFMLFFYRSDDLHIRCDCREELLALLTLRFANFNRNRTLKIFQVTDKQLSVFHQTNSAQNKMANIYDLPTEQERMKDREIKGEEEYKAELRQKEANIDSAPFEAQEEGLGFGEEEELSPAFNVQKDLTSPNVEFDEGRVSVLVGYRKNSKIKYEDFKLITLLGRGTFGKVFLAECKLDKKQYAIKAIRKDVLIEYNQVKNTQLEKDILFSCEHPFLVGMEYLFQSSTRLYFVMPFIRGGELYKIFKARKRLSEQVVKFYALQIVMAVGYLHSKGIMHRDLKLENILVDQDGYLKIIDYGLAKTLGESQLSKTFCGTPEYLAPEMVMHQGHDFSVDWWALGILIYEMLIGVTPFYNRERKLLLLKIRQSKVVFPDKRKYKIDYSDAFVDIVLKLLNKDKAQRLGSKGDFDEIIAHPFFDDIDKEKLLEGKIDPPLKLDIKDLGGDKYDNKYFNTKSTPQDLTETVLPQANMDKLQKNSNQFAKFDTQRQL